MPIRVLRRVASTLAATALLAGCGGGLYLGFELGGGFGDTPAVDLAVSPAAARAGDAVQLVAAASDRDGIDDVRFYRVESDGSRTLLGSDGVAPFEWSVVVRAADAAAGVLRLQAVARDGVGDTGDSAVRVIAVSP